MLVSREGPFVLKNWFMQDTIQLSEEIAIRSPELYAILKEMPVLLFDKNHTDTYITDFENYLQMLKAEMRKSEDTNFKKNSDADWV